MKKTIILLAAIFAALQGFAQQPAGDLNRQMDVTRDYEPAVNKADKLGVKPNMVDTTALRPELKYRIDPSPISYGFEVTPIKPANVSLDSYRQDKPVYLKAAVGVPFQSLLDAYYSSVHKTNGKWGAYVNHYGSWSDIKNINGIKTPAAQTFNKVGVFGEHRFGRFGIGGELGYDYDKVSRYGYDTIWQPAGERFTTPSASDLRQNFSTIRGKLDFGHSFEDLSYFNVRFGVGAAYFQDRFDMKQTDFNAYLDLGKRFGSMHEVTLRAAFDSYKGGGQLSDYKDNAFAVRPMYRLKGGKAEFSLGANLVFANDGENNETAFFPLFGFQWNAAKGFAPYVKIDGEYRNNGYRNTVARNPYVFEGSFGPNTSEYNGRVGIKGSASSSFSYNIFGGYSRYRNLNYYVNYIGEAVNGTQPPYMALGNIFMVDWSDVSMWTLGGELEGRISGSFGIEFGMQYRWYDYKKEDAYTIYTGLPDLTGSLGIKYNYRDKLVLRAGVDVFGPRDFMLRWADSAIPAESSPMWKQHIDMQFDVRLGAEYNISKTIGVFLEGRNLANQKMYLYNQYPSLGVNVLAGVKLQF